jgi:hypothetical protein
VITLSDWKSMSITQTIMEEFKRRQQGLKDELTTSAGIDPASDRYKVGAIAAYEDLLNIDLDITEETHGN